MECLSCSSHLPHSEFPAPVESPNLLHLQYHCVILPEYIESVHYHVTTQRLSDPADSSPEFPSVLPCRHSYMQHASHAYLLHALTLLPHSPMHRNTLPTIPKHLISSPFVSCLYYISDSYFILQKFNIKKVSLLFIQK